MTWHPTCRAEELSDMTSAASLSALLACCSPSAAITSIIMYDSVITARSCSCVRNCHFHNLQASYTTSIVKHADMSVILTIIITFALASLAASASAAMALCSCTGSLTSLL